MSATVQAAARVDVQPILKVRGLKYSYPNGLLALDGLDLDLRPGEIVSVVGPSGCGKSTMLSLISDRTRPTEGTIQWDESSTTGGTFGRKLSMVFQRDTVFPWRTVQKNLEFGMECAHLPKAERHERVESLLKLGKLEAFSKSYPGALSGGMRRRLALLVGLSVNPEVLLLDEPFSALDEPTRIELHVDVLRLVYQYRVSVLLVTHDLGEAISLSDRVMVMTKRPATTRRVFDIDFGHDRDLLTIRETPRYSELYREIWHELWAEIRADRS
jgi:NitT/TauT family transport system ATP-binding protein